MLKQKGVKEIKTFINNLIDFYWYVLMMRNAGVGLYYLGASEWGWAEIYLGFFIVMFSFTYKLAIEEREKQLQAKKNFNVKQSRN